MLDPLDADGRAIIDGNSFVAGAGVRRDRHRPLRHPDREQRRLFFYTDWAFQGETKFFIYEAEEFQSDGNFEGGARIGYSHDGGKWEVALFGRNITDEENVKGAIDFNNLTGFDNEPRIIGASFRTRF